MKKKLRDYFVPHTGNDYKPHSLQRAAVLGMTVMVLLTFAIANIQSVTWINSDWLVSTILPAVIVDLTNDERADGALGTVQRNSVLDQAAQLKAQHMAANQYFAHDSPEGITPWFWFEQAGYNYVHAGENLAIHFTDSDDVVEAWMDSPSHRANIMNGNYAEIGVGTAAGEYQGFKTVYVVQLFGTPAAAATAVQPEPAVTPQIVASRRPPIPAAAAAEPTAESAVLSDSSVVETSDKPISEQNNSLPTDDPEVTRAATALNGDPLFSDFISTSTGGIPATVTAAPESPPTTPSTQAGRLLTQPQTVLEFAYLGIAILVSLALFFAVFIEIRRQQPVQVAYAVMLLLLMYGLFELHTTLSGGAIIV